MTARGLAFIFVAACGGSLAPDAGSDASAVFMCGSAPCDGRTHYCNTSSAGPKRDTPPVCTPLPDGCEPASCACLPNGNLSAACTCEPADSGDGFMAGCSVP